MISAPTLRTIRRPDVLLHLLERFEPALYGHELIWAETFHLQPVPLDQAPPHRRHEVEGLQRRADVGGADGRARIATDEFHPGQPCVGAVADGCMVVGLFNQHSASSGSEKTRTVTPALE